MKVAMKDEENIRGEKIDALARWMLLDSSNIHKTYSYTSIKTPHFTQHTLYIALHMLYIDHDLISHKNNLRPRKNEE